MNEAKANSGELDTDASVVMPGTAVKLAQTA
jgi:hypothetical protein